MKRNWQCPKCHSQRVGYLENVTDVGEHGLESRKIGQAQTGSLFGLAVVEGHGDIEAFVCTDCGYFEEYVKQAQAIDWNGMRGFRWCHPELAGQPPGR